MSDTKKEGKGQHFLRIVNKNFSLVAATKEEKAAKKKATLARATLAPWYTPGGLLKDGKFVSIGKTGWLADEYEAFRAKVLEAETALHEDSPGADVLFTRAFGAATVADELKTVRVQAAAEIDKAVLLLTKLPAGHADFGTLEAVPVRLRGGLAQGMSPDKVLTDAQDLVTRLKGLTADPAPRPSQLENERLERRNALFKLIGAEDERLGELARSQVPKGQDVFIEADVRSRLGKAVEPLIDSLSKSNDKPGVDDAGQSKHLQQRFKAATDGIKTAAAQLEVQIKADGGRTFLNQVQEEQAEFRKGRDAAAAAAAYRESFKAVEVALSGLLDQGPPGAEALSASIRADSARLVAGNAFSVGDAFIATCLAEIGRARTAAAGTSSGAAAALQAAIAQLRSDLEKARKASRSRTKPAFAALIGEVDQLDTLARTGNTGAFGAANQRVLAIQAAGIGGAAKIAAFNAQADLVDAVVKNKDIRKEFQSEVDALLLAVRTVMDAPLDLQDLDPALAAMTGLQQEAAALRAKFDATVQWRAAVKPRLMAMGKQLAAFRRASPRARGNGTTYEQDMKAVNDGYEQVGVDRAEMERKLTAAEQGLATLTRLLKDNPAAAAAQLELDALVVTGRAELVNQETEDAARVKAELEADLAGFRTKLAATEAAVKTAKGDAEELSDLKNLFKQTRKKFQADDLDGARQQLRSIQPRLDALHTTPGGVTVQRVDELKKIGAMWDDASKGMQAQMTAISDAADKVARSAGLQVPEVRQRTAALHTSLQPFRASLVRNVLLLVDSDLALPARKAAREDALADVRSIRAALSGNPLAPKLELNPFGVASPFVPLQRLLANVEYNVLRAVPPE